jgi:hypothetical protein
MNWKNLIKRSAVALAVLGVMLPASASAQTLPAQATPVQCRVLQTHYSDTAWDWYCDDSGKPTYTEFGQLIDGGFPILPYPGYDVRRVATASAWPPDGSHPYIYWHMQASDDWYRWDPAGPNVWLAKKVGV